jgi:hypothetical protein
VNHRPLHIHSMMVHGVVAFALLAALSLVLESAGTTVGPAGPEVWALLLRGSLSGMLVLALPSIISGITERNHMYAGWPPSHRAKLVLSMALVLLVVGELMALGRAPGPPVLVSWLGLAVIVGNCCVVFGLSYFGLKITLGRQGLVGTSYLPDMDRKPPIDILSSVAEYSGDSPKLIDVQEEQTT